VPTETVDLEPAWTLERVCESTSAPADARPAPAHACALQDQHGRRLLGPCPQCGPPSSLPGT